MPEAEKVADRHGRGGRNPCPGWCVSGHGVHRGEEDWLHLGEPLTVAHGVQARLSMSVDPETTVADGPYLLVGSTEYTLPQAESLGAAIIALARTGAGLTRP